MPPQEVITFYNLKLVVYSLEQVGRTFLYSNHDNTEYQRHGGIRISWFGIYMSKR